VHIVLELANNRGKTERNLFYYGKNCQVIRIIVKLTHARFLKKREEVDMSNEIEILTVPQKKPEEEQILSLRNISFADEKGHLILKNVNLDVATGESVTILCLDQNELQSLEKIISDREITPLNGEVRKEKKMVMFEDCGILQKIS